MVPTLTVLTQLFRCLTTLSIHTMRPGATFTVIIVWVKIKTYVIGYLAWQTITGKHQEITLSFMRVGHTCTRCLVDGHFGLIKKIYTANLIQTLSVKWPKWLSDLLPTTFLNYTAGNGENGIHFFRRCLIVSHSSQHFRFSSSTPGIVYVCTSCIRITATGFRNYMYFCNLRLADVPAQSSVPEPQVERKRPHSDDADGRYSPTLVAIC